MPITEIITVELGTAIAKAMLKIWLKSDIVSNISGDLIDILKSQITNTLDQRRTLRQFETIGEKVADSLIPIFEVEGAVLDEGSKVAVALSVAETLNRSKISSDVLVRLDLDSDNLAKYIKLTYSSTTQGFNSTETALYERIIDESCIYIVDIASQLPAFDERTNSELLKRENKLLEIAVESLHETVRIRELLNPSSKAAHFEQAYRRSIIKKLDVLQLFGADISEIRRKNHLSVAYITLTAEQILPRTNYRRNSTTISSHTETKETKKFEILPINEVLDNSNRLLVRGSAGSGKTTLLQWIAVRSASRTFEKQLSQWNNTIPFFIRLRKCVQTGLPYPQTFPELIAPAIADTMPQAWVHQQLETGNAIVLVDGLDEVPVSKREEVRLWLKELVDNFPLARFIVTSRPHALEEGWMESEGFREAELQPMSLTDIYSFIDHWHKAVQEELIEEERNDFQSLSKKIKEEVTYNRSKRNLATSPLLCAMLCALNRERHQQIPSDRIELYEACCKMLLERRDKERQIELSDYPPLNYRQNHVLLEDLAYWLIRNGMSEAELKEVEDRFSRKLVNMQDIPNNCSGEKMRLFFVERTGMLREPEIGKIDFTHRTFEEFLAAYAAIDEADIKVLISHAHDDQWREVIIVAAGLATKPAREELIKGLIIRGDKEPAYRHQLHLLAISCLESTVELNQEVRKELEIRLKDLVPPKNRAEAKSLAVAGELVVPFLSRRQRYPALIAASCVRTLAIVGSEAALEALENYADDGRSTVTDELFRALDSFDKETYVQRILSRTVQGKYSLPMNFTALYVFENFPELTSINLSRCEQISDLTPLSKLKQLRSLNLTSCSAVYDLTPLKNLAQLITLNLTYCKQITDISPLRGLMQLISLNMLSCQRITDINPLAGLTQLKELNLWSCENIADLSPLSNLTQLTTLILSWCKQIKNLSFLSNLKQLETLDLTSCNGIRNLEPVANLTHLTSLNLYQCQEISDLSPLAELKNLKTLDLSFCTKISDLSPLIGLNKLSKLNLNGISQKDKPPLIVPQSIREQLKTNRLLEMKKS